MSEISKETVNHVKTLKPDMLIDSFPTVDTMTKCVKEYGIDRLKYAIMFFASNPYEKKTDKEYKELVAYCKQLLEQHKNLTL